MRSWALWIACVLLAGGCRGGSASPEDCEVIFNRMMALEMHELGFRDPVLLKKRTAALSVKLRAELDQCPRRPLPTGALACVATAASIEELSHKCLR